MKSQEQLPRNEQDNKDLLDHLDEFIEKNIEKHFRKGLEEVENFIKKEVIKDNKEGKKDSGPFVYIERFLKDPQVASVSPSTKFLIDRMLKRIDWKKTRLIVEYGPAEGVITHELLKRLHTDGVLVAVELNKDFASSLAKTPDKRLKVLNGSVVDIDKHMASLGLGPVDVIVSGIPFSFLKPYPRHQLLHKTEALLGPEGRFIAYQFTGHLLSMMKFHFPKVDIQFEIRNIPPAFVMTGFKSEHSDVDR